MQWEEQQGFSGCLQHMTTPPRYMSIMVSSPSSAQYSCHAALYICPSFVHKLALGCFAACLRVLSISAKVVSSIQLPYLPVSFVSSHRVTHSPVLVPPQASVWNKGKVCRNERGRTLGHYKIPTNKAASGCASAMPVPVFFFHFPPI